jgi:uncharacterized damage-inducible protein DinB
MMRLKTWSKVDPHPRKPWIGPRKGPKARCHEVNKLFSHWDQIHKDTLAVIDRFGEAELTRVAYEGGWSVGQIALHIANAEEGWFGCIAAREIETWPSNHTLENYPTKETIKALLAETHARTMAYLETLTIGDLASVIESEWGNFSICFIIWHVIEHEIHHRGELSLGGMIAQSFAVRYTEWLNALILADTAVSVRLTLSDKFQRYVLAPKWLMSAAIRWMTVPRFVDFSFKLAGLTRSAEWFGQDPGTAEYVRDAMLNTLTDEYLKIYDAIYGFDLLNLAAITVPTLILNGEHESKAVFRHTDEMLKLIPNAEAHVIPGAGHTSNMENPAAFNGEVERFLSRIDIPLEKNG